MVKDESGPAKSELCRASLSQFQKYLTRIRKKNGRVFFWDSLQSTWLALQQNPRPGLTLMLDANLGGYDPGLGFLPGHSMPVEAVKVEQRQKPEGHDSEHNSLQHRAVLLCNHLQNTYKEAEELCNSLQIEGKVKMAVLFSTARHDIGKAHPAFQNMLLQAMEDSNNLEKDLWAKSNSRGTGRPEYFVLENNVKLQRPYFRHELASMLAWLTLHPDDSQVNLIAYLIAAHHGKVRMGLRAQPGEAEPSDADRLYARGVWDGDIIPEVRLNDRERYPEVALHLDIMQLGEGNMGPSWTARTQMLLDEYGSFRLAWLESLVRLADQRASNKEQNGEPP